MFLSRLSFLWTSMFPNFAHTCQVVSTHAPIFFVAHESVGFMFSAMLSLCACAYLLLVLLLRFHCHFMVYVDRVVLSLL